MLDELNLVNDFTVIGSYVGQSIFPGTEGIGYHKKQINIEKALLGKLQDGDIVIISNANYFRSNMDKYKSELLDFADKTGVLNVQLLVELCQYISQIRFAPISGFKRIAISKNQEMTFPNLNLMCLALMSG